MGLALQGRVGLGLGLGLCIAFELGVRLDLALALALTLEFPLWSGLVMVQVLQVNMIEDCVGFAGSAEMYESRK